MNKDSIKLGRRAQLCPQSKSCSQSPAAKRTRPTSDSIKFQAARSPPSRLNFLGALLAPCLEISFLTGDHHTGDLCPFLLPNPADYSWYTRTEHLRSPFPGGSLSIRRPEPRLWSVKPPPDSLEHNHLSPHYLGMQVWPLSATQLLQIAGLRSICKLVFCNSGSAGPADL